MSEDLRVGQSVLRVVPGPGDMRRSQEVGISQEPPLSPNGLFRSANRPFGVRGCSVPSQIGFFVVWSLLVRMVPAQLATEDVSVVPPALRSIHPPRSSPTRRAAAPYSSVRNSRVIEVFVRPFDREWSRLVSLRGSPLQARVVLVSCEHGGRSFICVRDLLAPLPVWLREKGGRRD